jgi:hypothetical protein
MTSIMRDLLLVQSFSLSSLIEEYRLFFLGLLPSVFMLAVIVEYFDRLEPFTLIKRAFISILILTTVTSVYESSISSSMDTADEVLSKQKSQNILLMEFFDGVKQRNFLKKDKGEEFIKDEKSLSGALSFLKHHLFDSFVNDSFTITIYFITKLCFLILKVVYSLVYYLGYGLIGIPCLIYLFPSMGNVLRGAILSYLWCLVIPHILVFIISMIGTEINKGYISGQVIGGSMMGTALLFILTLFIAFTPLIGAMILNGSGISQAGGIIASVGANHIMNLPRKTFNNAALVMSGGSLGPKTKIAGSAIGKSYKVARGAKNVVKKSLINGKTTSSPVSDLSHNNDSYKTSVKKQSTRSFNQKGNISSPVNTFEGKNETSSMNTKHFNQQKNNGVNNGTIQKYGKIHRGVEKTPYVHRPNKRINPRTNSRYGNINQPSRQKSKIK